MQSVTNPSGVTGNWRRQMNYEPRVIAATPTKSIVSSNMLAIIATAFIGLGIVTVAGNVQASAIHDAAHDMRHATGFPCH